MREVPLCSTNDWRFSCTVLAFFAASLIIDNSINKLEFSRVHTLCCICSKSFYIDMWAATVCVCQLTLVVCMSTKHRGWSWNSHVCDTHGPYQMIQDIKMLVFRQLWQVSCFITPRVWTERGSVRCLFAYNGQVSRFRYLSYSWLICSIL